MIRGFTAALLLSLSVASGARAQMPEAALSAVLEASRNVTASMDVATPARTVAERVRSVLHDHENAQAWRELALAIPELAILGDAEIESTFAAARLAEELGVEPSMTTALQVAARDPIADEAASVPVRENEASGAHGLSAFLSADTLEDVGNAAALLVQDLMAALAALGSTIVVWIVAAGTEIRTMLGGLSPEDWGLIAQGAAFLTGVYVLASIALPTSRKPASARTSNRGRATGRSKRRAASSKRTFASARALWDDGVPVHEIARRTGLARDAVAVLLSRTQAVPA